MKAPKSRFVLLAALAGALVFFTFQLDLLPGIKSQLGRQKGFNLLANLLDIIKNDYLEETDPLRTADGAYRGLVNSLDVLSCYLDKDLTEQFESEGEDAASPGLVIFKRYNDFPQVRGVIPGSPAEKSGVLLGDVVSAVNGRDTLRMSLIETVLRLQGAGESPVELKILRRGETLEMSIPRARLHPEPWSFARSGPGPPVLTVHRLPADLAASLRKDLFPLSGDVGTPLIIDLRNCYAGKIEGARDFVNLFLRASNIGSLGKKDGSRRRLSCPEQPADPKRPLVIWVGPGTRGPSELVAGVLQEFGRAKIVGTVTPGLVARQEIFPLRDGSSVLLTTEIFSLPSGRLLWNDGIDPDVEVKGNEFSDTVYLRLTAPSSVKR